ncbi:MAG: GNAT family N-acetyltransferase [Moraxella sp.]|nr:GNAT family N-acetyltransferase [Moraxella sp.]
MSNYSHSIKNQNNPSFIIQSLSEQDFATIAELESKLQPTDAWTVQDLNELWANRAATGFGGLGIFVASDDTVVNAAANTTAKLTAYLLYQVLDVAEILRVGTDKAYQSQRLAYRLLSAWLAELSVDCLLEVRADNQAAIALYHKLDFKTIHVRRGYYKNIDSTRTDAWVMQKQYSSPKS